MGHIIRVFSPLVPGPSRLSVCFAALLSLLAIGCNSSNQPPAPHIPTYTTFDAPGSASGVGSAQGTRVVGITDSGIIAGYFYDSQSLSHGFLRDPTGAFTIFDEPDSLPGSFTGTIVSAVNNFGAVSGTYYGKDQQWHAFTRESNGQYTTLGSILFVYASAGGYPAQAVTTSLTPTTISDNGDVAGYFFDPNFGVHAFLNLANSAPILIVPPNSISAMAIGPRIFYLSAQGEAVGTFEDNFSVRHGFVRHSDGSFTVLDAPGFGTASLTGTAATYISADGTIVGYVVGPQISHSFVRSPDGTYALFDPPNTGAPGSSATFVSSQGVVAGNFTDASAVWHGYLRNPDFTYTVIDDPQAAQIPNLAGTRITGVNASGEIVGDYQDAQGSSHGFILK